MIEIINYEMIWKGFWLVVSGEGRDPFKCVDITIEDLKKRTTAVAVSIRLWLSGCHAMRDRHCASAVAVQDPDPHRLSYVSHFRLRMNPVCGRNWPATQHNRWSIHNALVFFSKCFPSLCVFQWRGMYRLEFPIFFFRFSSRIFWCWILTWIIF